MKLAAIQISILLVINLPLVLVAAATYWLLLTDADINYYLTFWPPKFWLAVSIGGLLVVIAGVVQLAFVFRWFLAMPWMVVGNASALLKRSASALSSVRLADRLAIDVGLDFCAPCLFHRGLAGHRLFDLSRV